MCGIVAEYGPAERAGAARMLARLTHRGPDDDGVVELDDSWLGHRRLSIMDVGGGRQPLVNAEGDLWLVGNGEIYNQAAVIDGLGARPLTGSDNEAALALLDGLGPRALGALEGMYAFVAGGEDGRFVAARDPVGIKPLYWARRGGRIRFASEMQAFGPEWRPSVEIFPPGCYWTPEGGLVRFSDATPELEGPLGPVSLDPPAEVIDRTREMVVDSVESQLMSDVRVGVFLSGGLDSSIVAAIAARAARRDGERLITFAVGSEGSSDLEAARRVAEYLDSEHHERVYTAEEANDLLPEVIGAIESFEPSLVRSAVPNYLLAELAAEHVKVVLTGEGADEIFAGYDYLDRFADPRALHDELRRLIGSLHSLNLQRCDRVTMAHGLEARVPFLDRDLIAFGMRLPPAWKLRSADRPEKLLLRLAFEDMLPHDIVWRRKEEFGDGSGAADALRDPELASPIDELEGERHAVDPPLRTREELGYYRMFEEALGGIRADRTVGRFPVA